MISHKCIKVRSSSLTFLEGVEEQQHFTNTEAGTEYYFFFLSARYMFAELM
jgi:hypothetical protein